VLRRNGSTSNIRGAMKWVGKKIFLFFVFCFFIFRCKNFLKKKALGVPRACCGSATVLSPSLFDFNLFLPLIDWLTLDASFFSSTAISLLPTQLHDPHQHIFLLQNHRNFLHSKKGFCHTFTLICFIHK
jgi:hypothetical protein